MIELKGVSKSYGGTVVLHELDLTIAAGRTTALIGPSGCGKSTLLRLMIGLVQPDAGSVSYRGREADARDGARRAPRARLCDPGRRPFSALECPRQRDPDGPLPGLGKPSDRRPARRARRIDAISAGWSGPVPRPALWRSAPAREPDARC